MKESIFIIFFLPIITTSCSKRFASSHTRTDNIAAAYDILQDVSYGSDAQQTMDIYLSKNATSPTTKKLTIVFLHGGGYYLSDKTAEERYIEPYLEKGVNVVNLNYRLQRGIPLATKDLTHALNYLYANNTDYKLALNNIILTGFSAGAHIATNVGLSLNNPEYPNKLEDGINILGIINFSGPVDGLDVVEKVFMDHENELFREIGSALFPSHDDYTAKEQLAIYEPITYFDKYDPPIFLWHGGRDDQIPSETFKKFVSLLNEEKDHVEFIPDGLHSPSDEELKEAYVRIFEFLKTL